MIALSSEAESHSSYATVDIQSSTLQLLAALHSAVSTLVLDLHHLAVIQRRRITATNKRIVHLAHTSQPSPAHAVKIPQSRTSVVLKIEFHAVDHVVSFSDAVIIVVKKAVIDPANARLVPKYAGRARRSANMPALPPVMLQESATSRTHVRRSSPNPAHVDIYNHVPHVELQRPTRIQERWSRSNVILNVW